MKHSSILKYFIVLLSLMTIGIGVATYLFLRSDGWVDALLHPQDGYQFQYQARHKSIHLFSVHLTLEAPSLIIDDVTTPIKASMVTFKFTPLEVLKLALKKEPALEVTIDTDALVFPSALDFPLTLKKVVGEISYYQKQWDFDVAINAIEWVGKIVMDKRGAHLVATSTLEGLEVSFPPFIEKNQTDVLPIRVDLTGLGSNKAALTIQSESELSLQATFEPQNTHIVLKKKDLQANFTHTPGQNNLDIAALNMMTGTNTPVSFAMIQSFLPLTVHIGKLRCHDTLLGEVQAEIHPNEKGTEWYRLSLANAAFQFQGEGTWTPNAALETLLQGELTIQDVGQWAKDYKISNNFKSGKGIIKIALKAKNALSQMSLKQMIGTFKIKIQDGQILTETPGVGRLFGLLSFEGIQKTLQLRFNELFKQGFSYHDIEGQIALEDEIFTLQTMAIDSTLAHIDLQGTASLRDEKLNMDATVTPKLTASLPAAAALAAAPAVGAAVFVLDKAFKSPLDKAMINEYHLSGTLSAPQVNLKQKKLLK